MEIDFFISDTLTKAIYQRLMSKGVICSFSSKLHCLNIVIQVSTNFNTFLRIERTRIYVRLFLFGANRGL